MTEHAREKERADKDSQETAKLVKLFCIIFLPLTKEVYSIAVTGYSKNEKSLFSPWGSGVKWLQTAALSVVHVACCLDRLPLGTLETALSSGHS